jgi:hypothetical protein
LAQLRLLDQLLLFLLDMVAVAAGMAVDMAAGNQLL